MIMFPTIQEPIFSKDKYINTAERYQYQYPIIMRYLKNKINNWNIGDFLHEQGAYKVVLYAITEFTELVIDDLNRCENPMQIASICDKNNKKYIDGFHQFKVIGINELVAGYKTNEFDKILVCSIFHANEIYTDLMEREIKLEDIISINTAIFNGRVN